MPGSRDAVLTLEATGPEAESLGPASRMRFRASGGTIGRTPDNDWVLPHALVSGRHADITFANGVVPHHRHEHERRLRQLAEQPVPKGQPTPLDPGEPAHHPALPDPRVNRDCRPVSASRRRHLGGPARRRGVPICGRRSRLRSRSPSRSTNPSRPRHLRRRRRRGPARSARSCGSGAACREVPRADDLGRASALEAISVRPPPSFRRRWRRRRRAPGSHPGRLRPDAGQRFVAGVRGPVPRRAATAGRGAQAGAAPPAAGQARSPLPSRRTIALVGAGGGAGRRRAAERRP